MKAYLDIETDGLSFSNNSIIIVGIMCNNSFKQIYELSFGISTNDLKNFLKTFIDENNIKIIVGFNVKKFDVPFLEYKGCDFLSCLEVKDLMVVARDLGLKGGLKKLEKKFGIPRKVELNFFEQRALRQRWIKQDDRDALKKLLDYNAEDVYNLVKLEKMLDEKMLDRKKSISELRKKFSESIKCKINNER